ADPLPYPRGARPRSALSQRRGGDPRARAARRRARGRLGMRGGADTGDDAGNSELARAELRLANNLDAMARIPGWTEGFGSAQGVPAAGINDLTSVIDEVVGNAIGHGYAAGVRGEIVVRLRRRRGEIEAEVEDDGRPFDPLQAPPPDLTAPLAERR